LLAGVGRVNPGERDETAVPDADEPRDAEEDGGAVDADNRCQIVSRSGFSRKAASRTVRSANFANRASLQPETRRVHFQARFVIAVPPIRHWQSITGAGYSGSPLELTGALRRGETDTSRR
jgi:hypothetical protein